MAVPMDIHHDEEEETNGSREPENDSSSSHSKPADELTLIRKLLRPPPITGLTDWGIPPPSNAPPDPGLKVRQNFS